MTSLRPPYSILLGDNQAGKTALARKYCTNQHSPNYVHTTGIEYHRMKPKTDDDGDYDETIKHQNAIRCVWDASSSVEYLPLIRSYYAGAERIALVTSFSFGNPENITSGLEWWLRDVEAVLQQPHNNKQNQSLRSISQKQKQVVVVATHSDEVAHQTPELRSACVSFSLRHSLRYVEVSCVHGGNVPCAFESGDINNNNTIKENVKFDAIPSAVFLNPASWSPHTHSLFSAPFRKKATAIMFALRSVQVLEWSVGFDIEKSFTASMVSMILAPPPPLPLAHQGINPAAFTTPVKSQNTNNNKKGSSSTSRRKGSHGSSPSANLETVPSTQPRRHSLSPVSPDDLPEAGVRGACCGCTSTSQRAGIANSSSSYDGTRGGGAKALHNRGGNESSRPYATTRSDGREMKGKKKCVIS